jgi:hypothetical protein
MTIRFVDRENRVTSALLMESDKRVWTTWQTAAEIASIGRIFSAEPLLKAMVKIISSRP